MKFITLILFAFLFSSNINASNEKALIGTLNLKLSIDGLYDRYTNKLTTDTVKVYLKNGWAPFQTIDSSKNVFNTTGNISLTFNNVKDSVKYYIIVKHKNTLETWSSKQIIFQNKVANYDFTIQGQAYGGNSKLSNGKYHLYSGDINQDGTIDLTDVIEVYNDANSFKIGNTKTDLDGDKHVSLNDVSIVYNNFTKYVIKKTPEKFGFKKSPIAVLSHPDTNFLWAPYAPVTLIPKTSANSVDSLVMYYINLTSRFYYRASSTDFYNFKNQRRIYGAYDEILGKINTNTWINFVHTFTRPQYFYVVSKSTDNGVNWFRTGDTMFTGSKNIKANMYAGEDVSAMYNSQNKLFYVYFRDTSTSVSPVREVALTKTDSLFKNFTTRKQLNLISRANFNNPNSKLFRKAVYNFNVIKIDSKVNVNDADWIGFGNVFTSHPQMIENNPPPYIHKDESTLQPYMFHSKDGENWKILNDTLPIIPVDNNKKQILVLPTVIGTKVFLYGIINPQRHNLSDPTISKWETVVWDDITIEEILSYIP